MRTDRAGRAPQCWEVLVTKRVSRRAPRHRLPKPQSTRLPVVGLLTKEDTQYIFTDSPGLLEPEYQLHEAMRAAALRAIDDAEVIAYLHPLNEAPAPPLADIARLARPPRAPVVTVYTKADLAASRPDTL